MKKTFEFNEVVTYCHSIEVEVDSEEDFDSFTEYVGNCVDSGQFDDKDQIVSEFVEEFGDDKVTFVEDGSPSVEIA